MSWLTEWKALSSRIHGLLEAGQFYSQTTAVPGSDSYSSLGIILLEQVEGIFGETESFALRFSHNVPDRASKALARFLDQHGNRFKGSRDTPSLDINRGLAGLMLLTAFESEMSFLFSDLQVHIKRRSERAFMHLQRSIAADPEVRSKWQNAFGKREEECEKLGATHLLLHGIWAFKANAAGGRTDLVFGDSLENTDSIERAAEGLVLTEWKIAQKEQEVANQFDAARKQAARYAAGMLAGMELAAYRFLVVVTKRRIDEPQELREGEVVYRHINIAVDPQTPSRG